MAQRVPFPGTDLAVEIALLYFFPRLGTHWRRFLLSRLVEFFLFAIQIFLNNALNKLAERHVQAGLGC
jgi:hypothetical protein